MFHLFEGKPDFINAEGVKWWLDRETMIYVKKKGFDTSKLQVCGVEEKDGKRTRVIVDNGRVVYENTNYEAIACHIDIMAVDRDFPK